MEINLGVEVEPLKINVDDVEVLRAGLVRHAREFERVGVNITSSSELPSSSILSTEAAAVSD